jgi:hypothetical protein
LAWIIPTRRLAGAFLFPVADPEPTFVSTRLAAACVVVPCVLFRCTPRW